MNKVFRFKEIATQFIGNKIQRWIVLPTFSAKYIRKNI